MCACDFRSPFHYYTYLFFIFQNGLIVTACTDGVIRVFSAGNGSFEFSLQGHTGPIERMCYDGSTVVSVGSDR